MIDNIAIDQCIRTHTQRSYSVSSEYIRRDQINQSLQSRQEAPAFVQAPHRRVIRRRNVRKGGRIFGKTTPLASAYMVASGEVLILRDGRLVDLVEAGELLDPSIWSDATAIAFTDCTLAPRPAAA